MQYNAAVNREYVWDISDTDRLLCQYSSSGTPFFVATNESWTPVAQLDAAGRVTDQFSFDPYGTLLSYDGTFYDRPKLEVGHQGLFFDRLDVPLLDSDGSENPRLAANAAGIYYNRARTYSPSLGRFLQADPNATGIVCNGANELGSHPSAYPIAIDIDVLYTDSPNLFSYLHGSPIDFRDPNGLESLGSLLGSFSVRASLVGAATGAGTNVAGYVINQTLTLQQPTWKGVGAALVGGAVTGAISGGFAGLSAGSIQAYAAAFSAGALGNTAGGYISGDRDLDLIFDAVFGGLGSVGGHFLQSGGLAASSDGPSGKLTGDPPPGLAIRGAIASNGGQAFGNFFLTVYQYMHDKNLPMPWDPRVP